MLIGKWIWSAQVSDWNGVHCGELKVKTWSTVLTHPSPRIYGLFPMRDATSAFTKFCFFPLILLFSLKSCTNPGFPHYNRAYFSVFFPTNYPQAITSPRYITSTQDLLPTQRLWPLFHCLARISVRSAGATASAVTWTQSGNDGNQMAAGSYADEMWSRSGRLTVGHSVCTATRRRVQSVLPTSFITSLFPTPIGGSLCGVTPLLLGFVLLLFFLYNLQVVSSRFKCINGIEHGFRI